MKTIDRRIYKATSKFEGQIFPSPPAPAPPNFEVPNSKSEVRSCPFSCSLPPDFDVRSCSSPIPHPPLLRPEFEVRSPKSGDQFEDRVDAEVLFLHPWSYGAKLELHTVLQCPLVENLFPALLRRFCPPASESKMSGHDVFTFSDRHERLFENIRFDNRNQRQRVPEPFFAGANKSGYLIPELATVNILGCAL